MTSGRAGSWSHCEETARALGIGRTAVYRLLQLGELSGVTIGRSPRFSVAELEAYVARLEEEREVSRG